MKPHWLATAPVLVFDPRLAADRTFPAAARFDRAELCGANLLLWQGGEYYLTYPRSWPYVEPAGPGRRKTG